MPDDQNQEFCMDCGAKIPDRASFCPECGEEIDTGKSDNNTENKLSQIGDAVKEGYDTVKNSYDGATNSQNIKDNDEGLYNQAKNLVKDAEGEIDPKMLIQSKGKKTTRYSDDDLMFYNKNLISFLEEGEQPHHLIYTKNESVLSVSRPKENEITPIPDRADYSNDEQANYSFLMPTDKRLLYIAAHDGQDDMWEFDYSDIDMVYNDNIGISDTLKFHTSDGCEYAYPLSATEVGLSAQSDAVDYIQNKVDFDWKFVLKHFLQLHPLASVIRNIRSKI